MPVLEHTNPELNLQAAFKLPPEYHGTSWVDLSGEVPQFDRDVPAPLQEFVGEVSRIAQGDALRGVGSVGCAYLRVVDAGTPENYMRWHRDNQDGGTRFHTAISTDGAPVNLAWPTDDSWEGIKVTDTAWQEAYQPANGDVVAFTTELHGVLPQPPRRGHKTIVFFATLYKDRAAADLYTTNNTATSGHATLPVLEQQR